MIVFVSMIRPLVFIFETLATNGAFELRLACVLSHVTSEVRSRGKAPLAHLAPVRVYPTVTHSVYLQVVAPREQRAAHFAFVFQLRSVLDGNRTHNKYETPTLTISISLKQNAFI